MGESLGEYSFINKKGGRDVFLYPLFFYFHAIYIKIYTSLFIFVVTLPSVLNKVKDMMWLLLAFLSAALLGFYDVFKKQSLKDNAVIPVLFLNTLFSSLIFLPLLYCQCGGREYWRILFLCACCWVGGASLCGVEICYCPFVVDVGIFWNEESAYHDCGTYKRYPSGDGVGRSFSGLW